MTSTSVYLYVGALTSAAAFTIARQLYSANHDREGFKKMLEVEDDASDETKLAALNQFWSTWSVSVKCSQCRQCFRLHTLPDLDHFVHWIHP
jgi:hypothetical protein